MDDSRMILLLRLPESGIVTGYPLNGMYVTGALPLVGERILVRTCESYTQVCHAIVIHVDHGRNLYRAKIETE